MRYQHGFKQNQRAVFYVIKTVKALNKGKKLN